MISVIGGHERAAQLTTRRRKEIASKAAKVRWKKQREREAAEAAATIAALESE